MGKKETSETTIESAVILPTEKVVKSKATKPKVPVNIPKPESKSKLKLKLAPLGITLLAIGIVAASSFIFYSHHHKKVNTTSNIVNNSNKVDELSDQNQKLKIMNANLVKTVNVLKKSQLTTKSAVAVPVISNTVAVGSSSGLPNASLLVTSAKLQTLAYFGNNTANAATTKVRVVYFTIKNLSKTTQTYDSQQIKALTDTGEVINAPVYAGPGSGNFWYTSAVSAGGSITEYLPFDETKNIVALEWSPPSSKTIDVPVPADQQ